MQWYRKDDAKGCARTFRVGQWVWRWYPPADRPKFGKGWQGPFLVTGKVNDVAYRIQANSTSVSKVIHVNHLKPNLNTEALENWLEKPTKQPGQTDSIPTIPDQTDNSDYTGETVPTEYEREVRTRSTRLIKPPKKYGFE